MDYYINQRLMVGKLPEAQYVPVRDWYGFLRRLANKLNRTVGKPLIPIFNLNNQFEDLDLNRVDLLHFFNGISYGRTPWVTSFETCAALCPSGHPPIMGRKSRTAASTRSPAGDWKRWLGRLVLGSGPPRNPQP